MIKFFRKIRKKLLSENKVGKYLIYAVGEILLVVIGILIALQLNNQNQERQTKISLSYKLESLIKNLENDRINLVRTKEHLTFKVHSLQNLLKLAGQQPVSFKRHIEAGMFVIPYKENSTFWEGPYPDSANKKFIDKSFLESGRTSMGGLNTLAFEEIKSSGMFSLIRNDSLNKTLNIYYDHFKIEFNQKYLKVLENWREEFKNQGAIFYNTDELKEPLKLITSNNRFKSSMKEVIYESIWVAYLVEERLILIDDFLIKELKEEVRKLN